MIPEMIKNEDDKINDKNVMITKMIKKNEKKIYFDLAQSVAASFFISLVII